MIRLAKKNRTPDTLHPRAPVEFSIYVYHFSDGSKAKNTAADWEKKDVTHDLAAALAQAKTLHKSGRYKKVEVKKKSFDTQQACTGGTTLKIYTNEKQDILTRLRPLLYPAMLCTLIFAVFVAVRQLITLL